MSVRDNCNFNLCLAQLLLCDDAPKKNFVFLYNYSTKLRKRTKKKELQKIYRECYTYIYYKVNNLNQLTNCYMIQIQFIFHHASFTQTIDMHEIDIN